MVQYHIKGFSERVIGRIFVIGLDQLRTIFNLPLCVCVCVLTLFYLLLMNLDITLYYSLAFLIFKGNKLEHKILIFHKILRSVELIS